MPVPASITELSTTAGNNSPAGSESPTTTDDYIRALSAFIASLRDFDATAYTKTNALGTVSQSGGIPTGALVEYGSNDNGEYWRFIGGLQICLSPSFATALNNATGSIYGNTSSAPTWTFPAVFASTPKAFSIPGTNSTTWGSASANETTTNCVLRAFAAGSIASSSVSGIAVGRWH